MPSRQGGFRVRIESECTRPDQRRDQGTKIFAARITIPSEAIIIPQNAPPSIW